MAHLNFIFHLKTNKRTLDGEAAGDDVKTRLEVALMRLKYARLCSDSELSPYKILRLKSKAGNSPRNEQISQIIPSSVCLYAPIRAEPQEYWFEVHARSTDDVDRALGAKDRARWLPMRQAKG